ncbi:MAG: Hsp70 family protein, partial [Myxococcales bacterium]|nr:Hsp70 family protein [Myxococcales bacterium]
MRLGIDFGTTRTVVSAALDGRYPVASFELADGYRDYLRGLAVQTGDALHFGDEAAALLADGAAGITGVVRSVKRAITGLAPDDRVDALAGRPVDALELAAAYLAWLRDAIRTRSNLEVAPNEPLEVTIAVPAGAGSRQRFLTLEAFTRAGFEVAGLVNEPTAAAVEYAHRHLKGVGKRSPKRYVVIYDLGGGTF